jgi:hypothetical protein
MGNKGNEGKIYTFPFSATSRDLLTTAAATTYCCVNAAYTHESVSFRETERRSVPRFMATDVPSPCAQQPVTGPYPEPHHIIIPRSKLILALPSNLRPGHTSIHEHV